MPLRRGLRRVLPGGGRTGLGRAGHQTGRLGECRGERLGDLALGRDGPSGEGHRANADDAGHDDDREEREPGDLAQAATGKPATGAGGDPAATPASAAAASRLLSPSTGAVVQRRAAESGRP